MRICFLAPSGFGKSTAIDILQKHFELINIKIGKPLYDLQNVFYQKINKEIGNKQDGELLQFLGYKVRKEDADFLLKEFYNELTKYENDYSIITNDDCRPADYQFLKNMGFVFIKIKGYCRDRLDHTPINKNHVVEWNSEIEADYEVFNEGSIEDFEKNLLELMEVIKNDRQMLHRTHSK